MTTTATTTAGDSDDDGGGDGDADADDGDDHGGIMLSGHPGLILNVCRDSQSRNFPHMRSFL